MEWIEAHNVFCGSHTPRGVAWRGDIWVVSRKLNFRITRRFFRFFDERVSSDFIGWIVLTDLSAFASRVVAVVMYVYIYIYLFVRCLFSALLGLSPLLVWPARHGIVLILLCSSVTVRQQVYVLWTTVHFHFESLFYLKLTFCRSVY